MKDVGGCAFPNREAMGGTYENQFIDHQGMTLRDYFAGQALVGLLAAQPDHVTVSGMPGRKIARDEMADEAYWYADRMLKRRNNEDI